MKPSKRTLKRFNVKDYGAVGDGVHDDTEAIRRCAKAAGEVYLPPGVYFVKPLTFSKN